MTERGNEGALDGAGNRPTDGEKPGADDAAWAVLGFRKAGEEVVRFAKATRSLGLASWGIGITFAAAAVGLRFWSAAEMTASEFISCIVFASLLVAGGYCMYVLESRGYVRLVGELMVRDPLDGRVTKELPPGGQADAAHAAPVPPDAVAVPANAARAPVH
jgi:hypothetical protein